MKCDICGAQIVNGRCTYCGKEFNSEDIEKMRRGEFAEEQYKVEKEKRKKVSQKGWFIILMLIVFFPVGLYLMWKNAEWSMLVKIAVTVIVGLTFFRPIMYMCGIYVPSFGMRAFGVTIVIGVLASGIYFVWAKTNWKKVVKIIATVVASLIMVTLFIGPIFDVDLDDMFEDDYYEDYDPTEDYANFEWSTNALPQMLPEPKSHYGVIYCDDADYFEVDVANTTKQEFKDYVTLCKEQGFVIDYSEEKKYYSAQNEDGYDLSLMWDNDYGIDVMEITLDAENTKETTKATKASSDSGIDPEFKEAMEAYEDFMDDYVAFMKKYKESSNQAGMMSDYTDYMAKYSDAVSKFDEVDEDELTEEELALYNETLTRVNNKLLEVQ